MATETIDFTALEETQDAATAQPQETTVEATPSPEGTEQQSTPQDLDGRRGPANIRNSIKAASEAIPDQAAQFKELGNAYFREQAYAKAFPTPQEAASAKQLIEGVGGIEGISKLQELSHVYEQQDEFLKEGNPEVLDDFAKDFPEGFAALAPAYLERLSKINPQAFQEAVGPYSVDLLVKAGVEDTLKEIYNSADPKPGIEKLYGWLQQQKQARAAIVPQKNPAQDKIQQQQTQIQQEREQIFMERVQDKVNASVSPEITKAVDQYAKQYKLNDTQKAHFQTTLQNRIVEEMKGDKTYGQQIDMRKANKGRTHDTVASYISSEFNRRIKDAAFAVAKDVYGAPRGTTQPTGVVRAGTPKTAPSGGPLFVSQRPPDSQLDLNRPNADMLLIQGRGYTKDGRFVTWRKA